MIGGAGASNQSFSGGLDLVHMQIGPQIHSAHQDPQDSEQALNPPPARGSSSWGTPASLADCSSSTQVRTILTATVLSQHALKQMVSSVPANTDSISVQPTTHPPTLTNTSPHHSTAHRHPRSPSALGRCQPACFARLQEGRSPPPNGSIQQPNASPNSTAPRHSNRSRRVLPGLKLLRVRLQLLLR